MDHIQAASEILKESIRKKHRTGIDNILAGLLNRIVENNRKIDITNDSVKKLVQALGEILVADGVLTETANLTGPQLLSAAQDYIKQKESEVT